MFAVSKGYLSNLYTLYMHDVKDSICLIIQKRHTSRVTRHFKVPSHFQNMLMAISYYNKIILIIIYNYFIVFTYYFNLIFKLHHCIPTLK